MQRISPDHFNELLKYVSTLFATIGFGMIGFGILRPLVTGDTMNVLWLIAGLLVWSFGLLTLTWLRDET